MRLSAPKKNVFWISVVIVLVSVVVYFVADFDLYAVIGLLVGYGLLAAGNVLKGF